MKQDDHAKVFQRFSDWLISCHPGLMLTGLTFRCACQIYRMLNVTSELCVTARRKNEHFLFIALAEDDVGACWKSLRTTFQ